MVSIQFILRTVRPIDGTIVCETPQETVVIEAGLMAGTDDRSNSNVKEEMVEMLLLIFIKPIFQKLIKEDYGQRRLWTACGIQVLHLIWIMILRGEDAESKSDKGQI
ncbi:uncharacterized protein LOC124917263 [Impatiens glandulifera]|uniref:uncharacterized protein LOC124917263 n=1 Tax=Impatiens glandulifera TaxID=253017 RepID=UPI001FB15F78|nr:uncharacterized protein LOC124917263 [Impatiens glandulifera]XP_047313686.1 uncharacterized protein LOC124917263 [Impatiens glandulifera]XP_047313687.1 uncharacterized protein LOC124917263 [Impatiens glandulifera]XP_047313688.1 uncharacterized protein LOC124917263 [Impatiens glandulifera]XP_047313689.1 uncharacterized protein LOC124917263 [Impatiens glandulifera]XP_047313691.1 uncharacterized protein LOC124917263 [Impatiens glandulifera]XP_047313692.1 uncharacterized protein LOC124917263 [